MQYMIKNQKDGELNKEFSLEGANKLQAENSGEQLSPVLEKPKIEIEKKEAESKKEKIEEPAVQLSESDRKKIEEQMVSVAANVQAEKSYSADEVDVKKVENILQDGLEETYKKMDPVSRAQFKSQGEDTAKAINLLMRQARIKIKEIVDLIVKWLKLIPGVNKFFVEQEAKIKADKLMAEKRRSGGDTNDTN
jgi:hypothetical protein